MEHVQWARRPALHQPVLVTAFSGWNDAGDAASNTLLYLADQLDAEPFATIDGDEFYDYTETRPSLRLVDGHTRSLEWPQIELLSADLAGRSTDPAVVDVILLTGPEPQLRWRSFCRNVTELAAALGVHRAVHLGALLSEVPHSRPVPVVGSGNDGAALAARGLELSRYEGPTGIVGVLHDACTHAGIDTTSLWAAVPTYVSGAPSPKATLALVSHTAALLHLDVDETLLKVAAEAYEREVDALVSDDDETVSYVQRLELRHDLGDGDDEPALDDVGPVEANPEQVARLTEEIERFLREHGDG